MCEESVLWIRESLNIPLTTHPLPTHTLFFSFTSLSPNFQFKASAAMHWSYICMQLTCLHKKFKMLNL